MPFQPGPVLLVRNLAKTFPGQQALRGVDLELLPGEVHGLVGENGSGKSTLIKCLSGYHAADEGAEIILDGQRLPAGYSSNLAHGFGLSFVHQDLGLIPSLSVLENLLLGRGFATGLGYRIRWRHEARRAVRLFREFGHTIAPSALVRHLSPAERTIVAIVRGLQDIEDKSRVLVLDEATAALPHAEVERVFEFLRRAARRGLAILYVSHRLEEVLAISDRITVLRDGGHAGVYTTAHLSERRLAELIVGRPLSAYYPPPETGGKGYAVLKVENLCGERVKDVGFVVRRGEILGIAGLLGSGRSEIARLIFGAETAAAGRIELEGKPLRVRRPLDAVKAGIALVPEDRRREGSIPRMTVTENITLPDLSRFTRFGMLRRIAEREFARRSIAVYKVRPSDVGRLFYTLSGGNQQKAILARWMELRPKVLLLDEPTQGVDIGSKTELFALIEQAASLGTAVILISSDLAELEHLCHRVLVLREGRLVGELDGENVARERMLDLVYAGEQ